MHARRSWAALAAIVLAAGCSLLIQDGPEVSDGSPGSIDASFDPEAIHVDCDAPGCGSQCEAGKPCVLHCDLPTECGGDIDCGDASHCTVRCEGSPSCQEVRCIDDVACEIQCVASNSCLDGALCDAPLCRVLCSGSQSCTRGTVGCQNTAVCDIDCLGDFACDSGVFCGVVGVCDISCTGAQVCNGGVRCSDDCDVQCVDTSCLGGIHCSQTEVCDVYCIGGGCAPSVTCPSNCLSDSSGCAQCS